MFKMFEFICWIIAAEIINTSIGETPQVLRIISLAILGIQAIKWTIDEED